MHKTFEVFEELVSNLTERIDAMDYRSHSAMLKKLNPREVIESSLEHVTTGIISKETFVSTTSKIGSIMMKGQNMSMDTPKAVKIGSFILESYCEVGLISKNLRTDQGAKTTTYYIVSEDRQGLSNLVQLVGPLKMQAFPSTEPFVNWESGVHANGLPLIRHAPIALLEKINMADHSVILDSVNRLQSSGWKVNRHMLGVMSALVKEGKSPKVLPHQDKTKPSNTRKSLELEVEMIQVAADNVGSDTFYHQYNVDFRGRIYPSTAFLNEQTSDRSKGLLLFAEGKAVKGDAMKWLQIHTANTWGNDKVDLAERQLFCEMQVDTWIEWALDPLNNRGWMEADKPWSFLAAITEMVNAMEDPEYISHLPIFIDGSNNGVQHMSALARDAGTAALVNVVPTDLPGDVYMFIKDAVYTQIRKDYEPKLDYAFREYQSRSMEFDRQIMVLKGQPRKDMIGKANEYRKGSDPRRFAPNFFMSITDGKIQRKLVKRPVMTLGYGGTRRGFKNQIIEDTKQMGPEFRSMSHSWAAYFGDLIYFTSRGGPSNQAELPGLAQMLDLFETLASRAMDDDDKLSWNVPGTNFPVIQQYKKAKCRIVEVSFMGQRLQLHTQIFEDTTTNKRKQKTSASPNIIHSFDAAHLQLTINACDFRITTIHDSFGCLPGDMGDLFRIVREEFARFYQADPLQNLLAQQNALELMPERGDLDVTLINKSEYAFI